MKKEKKQDTTSIHTPDLFTDAASIDADGKASDMDPEAIMSADGCNPVNRDSEMQRAHDRNDAVPIPGILPGIIPGAAPGTYAGNILPVYFPGSNFYSGK